MLRGVAIATLIAATSAAHGESKSYDAAVAAYETCLKDQSRRYAPLCDPADLIARAVVAVCDESFRQVGLQFSLSFDRLPPNEVENLLRDMRRQYEDGVLAQLLTWRLDRPCQ